MNAANDIIATKRTLSEILFNHRYKIDVFQREYSWGLQQIESLINDLTSCFLRSYHDGDTIANYDSYDCYFMGSIVLCDDGRSHLSIIDGQQRLTSFSILLIYLNHKQRELNIPETSLKNMSNFLFITKGGVQSLVLNIESREQLMRTLIEDPNDVYINYENFANSESNKHIIQCYNNIERIFPSELLTDVTLPLFIEWLLDKIILVEIKSHSIDHAYTIFETVNDRGLNLKPAEILKGYLLSKIVETHEEQWESKAEEANIFWIDRLQEFSNKEGISDSDFFRAWLRGKYAQSTRSTKAGSVNEDFETIANNFHSWVKDNASSKLKLKSPRDYYFFIRSDFDYYTSLFLRCYKYKTHASKGHELLYVNNFYTIADSLSYPLLMASITKLDDEETVEQKIRIVSSYLDCYSNVRMLQSRAITQSSIRNSIYELIKRIRDVSVSELISILSTELYKQTGGEMVMRSLHMMNNWGYCHYFFARLIHHLHPVHDFRDLLRSRKQSSYVLIQISTKDDYNDTISETTSEILQGAVANYCIVHRSDAKHVESLVNIQEKMSYLWSVNAFPELEEIPNEPIFDFISRRGERLAQYAQVIWSFESE